MATTIMSISHVLDYENELNDNLYNIKILGVKKLSISRKVKKILKPLTKLMNKKRNNKFGCKKMSKMQKAEPQVEVFTEEVDNQNNCNEALEQRLLADLDKAEEGAAITVCLDGQMTVVPVVPGLCYVPVHFAHTHAGDFYWTTVTSADKDFWYKDTTDFSLNQRAEIQVA